MYFWGDALPIQSIITIVAENTFLMIPPLISLVLCIVNFWKAIGLRN